jgi:6-pyruvoyltetrahydropterin/6-carboxytetrahydropterin synthase
MSETYNVRVTKDYLVFSAAHFITYNGDLCERLHGHNYRVAAEVFGPLDENRYVVDFIHLRDTLGAITGALDHHMLLPLAHPLIKVEPNDRSVEVTFEDRRWVFPRGDCILLPVANTTTELLAQYIGQRLLDTLAASGRPRPARLRIEVDECYGQLAIWDWTATD